MTRRDLAAIGVRLMAILALLLGVHAFGSGFSDGVLDDISQLGWAGLLIHRGFGALLRAFGPFLVLSFLAIILWVMADALAYFIAGRGARGEEATLFSISALDVLVVLLSVTGIYLAIVGASALTTLIGFWLLPPQSNGPFGMSNSFFSPPLLGALVNFGLGLLLVFRASPIANSLPATRQLLVQSPLVTAQNMGRDAEYLMVPEGESPISARPVEPEQRR